MLSYEKNKEKLNVILSTLNLAPTLRAEQLSTSDFVNLSKALQDENNN